MTDDDVMAAESGARLVAIEVADPPDSWAGAGFTVEGDVVHLGGVVLHLVGDRRDGKGTGMVGWTISGLAAPLGAIELDGLPTDHVADGPVETGTDRAPHPNGAMGLDHVVVMTPALERTIEALEASGLSCRRIRETTTPDGTPIRQAFFRLGPTVLEVVGGPPATRADHHEGPDRDGPHRDDDRHGAGRVEPPARWWGLAIDVADLDETAVVLGGGLGRIKTAVQRGRRIATLRQRDLGLSVAVAVMDDHGDR